MHPSQTAYCKNPKLTRKEGQALMVAVLFFSTFSTERQEQHLLDAGVSRQSFNSAVAKLHKAIGT